jgi:chromosome segregation ATPase
MHRHLTIALLVLASLLTVTLPTFAAGSSSNAPATRIKKCQDAQGQWHYGDDASDACARSKVIELDTRGIKRGEIAAPLTEAELKAREQNREAEEKQHKLAEEQNRRDQQLLATYAIEDDIVLTRDRKLSDIESQIRASQDTLDSLRKSFSRVQAQAAEEQRTGKAVSPQTAKTIANNEAQIAKHEAHIQNLKKEQETVRTQFQADLQRFRELKGKQVAPAAGPPAIPTQKK